MIIQNKKILVVGLGKSGVAVARFLKKRGASVIVTDMADAHQLGESLKKIHEMGIRADIGVHHLETFENADMIVISPGVPHTIPPVQAAREKGIPILGEIELASRFIREPILGITGTNGKTTTTTLVGKMLENSGLNVFVGGNIGTPLISYPDNGEKADILVIEISSFQLDTIERFRPKVGVLLNITEDHLDRYPSFQAYVKSKRRLFENQQENDVAILNDTDPIVHSVTQNIQSKKINFGNWRLHNGILKLEVGNWHKKPVSEFNFQLSDSRLIGKHNIENISAACLSALAVGGTSQGIQSALNDFQGLPHRLEYVGTVNHVRYFDDSKATNTDAVLKALEAFTEPVILIMGGRGKSGSAGDYNPFCGLKDWVRRHVKKLIAMGETKDEIVAALGETVLNCKVDSMDEAVSQAYQSASPGDVVLLSPACSSFDMYRNYAERGEAFCHAVKALMK